MNDINLLPQELKPSKSVLKLSENLKKMALLSVLVLLISVTLSLGAYLFYGQRVSSSLANQEKLKTEIKAMEKTEQRIVLVKDRLSKINLISANPRANDEVVTLDFVSKLFPDGTLVEGFELDDGKANIAISSERLSEIATYLASVISSGKFKQVNLVSLLYSPLKGYVVDLSFPE